jgi:hypothetical protein
MRGLAKRVGVSEAAIRKAVKAGKLKDSVVYENGHPVIADMERACLEWQRQRAHETRTVDADAEGGTVISAETLVEAQRLATIERARKLRLENDLREGSLVELSKVNREAFEAERIVREAILNLPARLSAELAGETDSGRVYLRLDAALRDALNAAAHTLETAVAG